MARKVRVHWTVTERHSGVVELPDTFPVSRFVGEPAAWLAEITDEDTYVNTVGYDLELWTDLSQGAAG